MQRGFLKGRNMLHNILDIDWQSMMVSLKHKGGALVLFDFKAAFPSISHPFLLACLKHLVLPASAMNFVHVMYDNNKCYLRLHGKDYPGFNLNGGVRQGCPLSPLLFAVCVDILLRMITVRLGHPTIRAFADDIAAIVLDWREQCGILKSTFDEFERISNLGLNVKKTVVIPLWYEGREEVKAGIGSWAPGWDNVLVEFSGTYLGFKVGPGKGCTSWDKPLNTFHDRVRRWRNVGGGMQFATLAYNVFAVSVLSYIAQLEEVPRHVVESERARMLHMFPGPGTWIIPEDLWFAAENFGLAKSAVSVELMARAAKFRVAVMGCRFSGGNDSIRGLKRLGGDNIHARWHELRQVMSDTDYLPRVGRWHNWYRGSYCKVLIDNMQWLKSKGITRDKILSEVVPSPSNDERADFLKAKKGMQRAALKALKAVVKPDATERIRHKIERWRNIPFGISGLPGYFTPVIGRRMRGLAKLVNPRVHAAVFRAAWNGWCTHRRFQRRLSTSNKCMFMCGGQAEDSIEHYCRCPVTMRAARHIMHLSYPAELALDVWVLNSGWWDSEDVARGLGLLMYGCYMAFNSIRCKGVSCSDQAFHCIAQHCRQGAMGNNKCMEFIDTSWQRPMKHVC